MLNYSLDLTLFNFPHKDSRFWAWGRRRSFSREWICFLERVVLRRRRRGGIYSLLKISTVTHWKTRAGYSGPLPGDSGCTKHPGDSGLIPGVSGLIPEVMPGGSPGASGPVQKVFWGARSIWPLGRILWPLSRNISGGPEYLALRPDTLAPVQKHFWGARSIWPLGRILRPLSRNISGQPRYSGLWPGHSGHRENWT